ncbi:hypothetical protein PENTCL1PPCAC_15142, partial [Pristionchus entomophagus]
MLENLSNSKGMLIGMAFHFLTEINEYIVDNVERVLKEYHVEDEPTCFVHVYKQRMVQNANTFLEPFEEKLRQEVHSVVGRDRLPSMADQPKMLYARACVLEVHRCANVLQTNVNRVAVRDVEIRGQIIPKDTWINADIHYLMANDPLFENPEVFRPERYIAEDGKSLRKDLVEITIPFSIGKRVCVGEGLARVEIFLGITATVQHFKISPRPGEIIDLEPQSGQLLLPKPQNLRILKV